MSDFSSFASEIRDQLKCYVYRLIDPMNGETFYVGRGQGNRVFDHVSGASVALNDESEDTKEGRIRRILASDYQVIHIIHRHGMSQEAAIEVEAALIDLFPGLTNKQGGERSSDFGPANAVDIIKRYSLPSVTFDATHKIIAIKVSMNTIEERGNRLEATRSAWRASLDRANKCDFVLSVTDGIIREVYNAKGKWSIFDGQKDRIAFEANGADQVPAEVMQGYKNKRLSVQARGAQNPISYHNA
jgi:uncharacterized protein